MSFADDLASHLPLLDARLRRPEIEAIAARLGDDAHVVERALAWLAEGPAEIEGWERDLEEVRSALAAAPSLQPILQWLERRGDPRHRAADRRATKRKLGFEVLRERTARSIEAIGVREELLLKLLRGRCAAQSPIPMVVRERLRASRRWPARKAAAELMLAHAEGGGPPGDAWEEVVARADTASEHPWVRDACDAWLLATDPARGVTHLAARLTPKDEPRHFLLRRLRVERLLAHAGDAALPLLHAVVSDPSEHVRIGLARALTELATPDALQLLTALASAPTPRVRLAVAEHVGRAAARVPLAPTLALLTHRLTVEQDGAALQALARAAASLGVAHPEAAPALREALDAVIRQDRHGASTEEAAIARRRLTIGAPTMDLVEQLRARVAALSIGQRQRFTWAELGCTAPPSEEELGRALVLLTREDAGLWVDCRPQGLTLQRGDRLKFRLWRFLHELRHPAPNKRQSWTHLVGRHAPSRLRVPPGRMAEVTATAVPGERTVIDREGSWGPALPTVDDALDVGQGAQIHSAFGQTQLHPPRSWWGRTQTFLRISWNYAALARLRSASLAAHDPAERRLYVETLARDYGIQVQFNLDQPAPPRMEQLSPAVIPWMAWLGEASDALLAPGRTSQPSLAIFTSILLGFLLADAAWRREQVRRARRAIPLVIGGWGTRGKSGTERIKAGLFHGLGHSVLVKTTGCEAMFIPAFPGQSAREVFLFRPHDKSSIWEQARVTQQAAAMGARVLLWECMALRPPYVRILERDWMRDDLVTLTNAFPDHEDVQGPAGHDIAEVISTFIPQGSTALTTEVEFLPLFRDAARARKTELDAVSPMEAELLGADLLGLFPYQEHPRNIALVARMAERLGVDPLLAIATMAENVVPDLGVLRIYPVVRVAGRDLRFINGMSANERTGCVANWRRTGCDRVDVEAEPDHAIVVVVNNRADRVARSEVFARIIVQDLSADAFVLIGTNLTGLHGYIETALDAWLADLHLPEDRAAAAVRVSEWMARLRIAQPTLARALVEAQVCANGVGAQLATTDALREALSRWLAADGPFDIVSLTQEIVADTQLRGAWESALVGHAPHDGPPEVVAPPDAAEGALFLARGLARLALHARLLRAVVAGTLSIDALRNVYRTLLLAALHPIADPTTSGDQIIVTSARTVRPGSRVTLMGIQNIKGTGLDFAYRWVALGTMMPLLDRARSADQAERLAGLRGLAALEDSGLVDAGTAASVLASAPMNETDEERALRLVALARAQQVHRQRLSALTAVTTATWRTQVLRWLEALLEPVDAIRRWWSARQVMRALAAHHISLADAAEVMQAIQTRQKGGWLSK